MQLPRAAPARRQHPVMRLGGLRGPSGAEGSLRQGQGAAGLRPFRLLPPSPPEAPYGVVSRRRLYFSVSSPRGGGREGGAPGRAGPGRSALPGITGPRRGTLALYNGRATRQRPGAAERTGHSVPLVGRSGAARRGEETAGRSYPPSPPRLGTASWRSAEGSTAFRWGAVRPSRGRRGSTKRAAPRRPRHRSLPTARLRRWPPGNKSGLGVLCFGVAAEKPGRKAKPCPSPSDHSARVPGVSPRDSPRRPRPNKASVPRPRRAEAHVPQHRNLSRLRAGGGRRAAAAARGRRTRPSSASGALRALPVALSISR